MAKKTHFVKFILSEHVKEKLRFIHSVHPSPFLLGVLSLGPNFQKKGEKGLTESQFLEGGCWKQEGVFFRRELQILNKK